MNLFDDFDPTENVNMVSTTTYNVVPPMGTSDYEENKKKRKAEMKQAAPAHYPETLEGLNTKYYNETRVNQSYYLRTMRDVASSGMHLIKANYRTHDFKHSGDLLGNIISFHDEDMEHTVNCWSQLLKYKNLWLTECKGNVTAFQAKLQSMYNQLHKETVPVKRIHLYATADKVYPVVANVDFDNQWISKDEIIICFTKIAHTNKKAKVKEYENFPGGNNEDKSEEKDTWSYIAGTQTLRMPLRFMDDLVHGGQRVLMDSLLSSVVMTNNTFEDKADVKRILIKLLRRIHDIIKQTAEKRTEEEKKIVRLVQALNFKLCPAMLGEIMSQLAKLTLPQDWIDLLQRWGKVGEETTELKAMVQQDVLRQSRLRGHLIALTVDRPAFMAALLKLEVALSTTDQPILFNNPVNC